MTSIQVDDPNANYDEGFKLKTLPADLSQYELGFAIDANVISPQFYLVHQNLGLERVVVDESSKLVNERYGSQVWTAMALAQKWLIKNGAKQPPRKIHIRTDYDSQRGPLGRVHTFEYNSEKKSYSLLKDGASIPRT